MKEIGIEKEKDEGKKIILKETFFKKKKNFNFFNLEGLLLLGDVGHVLVNDLLPPSLDLADPGLRGKKLGILGMLLNL